MNRTVSHASKRRPAFNFGPQGQLREKIGTRGRLHIDRWLPFLVLQRSADPAGSIARQVAVNSPSYLIWSPADDAEAELVLDTLVERLEERLGPVLLIEVDDSTWHPAEEGSPELPPFELSVAASGSGPAKAAIAAFVEAAGDVRIDLRRPEVRVSALEGDAHRLTLSISPIHRAPAGGLYPQLARELAVALLDLLLRAASAFMGAAGESPPPHFRSLGRSAILAAALHADKALDALARSFDFLLSVSPINSAEAMREFVAGGEEQAPRFRYRPLTVDPDAAKRDLYAIELSIFEDPLLEQLLCEKRREIDAQLTMLATRNTPGFRPASMLLYGTVSPQLLVDAHAILERLEPGAKTDESVGADDVADAARRLVQRYRAVDPRFDATIAIRDDVAGLLVSGGTLMIAGNSAISRTRLDALLAHEVSVHLLTYFNGATQGLSIFRTGLAGYEGIQEGLGVFAEWAVGGLTPARMRLLAGRVVAVEAMIDGADFVGVYRRLTRDFGFGKKAAFDITARVFRSGGFAKDAIYLQGFRDVVDRLATGASLDAFWLGKIAPEHVEAVEELLLRGLLHEPTFVPEFLSRGDAGRRIERLRSGLSFDRLLDPE